MLLAIPLLALVILALWMAAVLVKRRWGFPGLCVAGGVAVLTAGALVWDLAHMGHQPPSWYMPLQNMKQIAIGLIMYADDNDRYLPQTFGTLFPYASEGEFYLSEGSTTRRPRSGLEVDEGQCDLLYFGAGRRIEECAMDEPLVTTKPIFAKKAGYAFAMYPDGHVELHRPVPESIKALWQQRGEGQQIQ